MPNGERPPRELRLTLTRDDGRVEIVFTDSKGKFQLTGDLNRDREYTITIEGDGQTFDTTTATLRLLRAGISYLPIFLRPHKAPPRPPSGVIDVAALEINVPAAARERYAEALKLINEGRAEAAARVLKEAIGIYPEYLRALNDLGVLYLKLNRLNEAADALRKANKIDKRFQISRLNLGIVLNRQGKYAEATETLSTLHRENPTLNGLRLALADALIGNQRLSAAADVLRLALTDPTLDKGAQMEAHYKLGVVLSREERYAEAVIELEKAIGLDPKAANAHLLLGGALLQLKRYPEAERELLLAYELAGPAMGAAQLLLGEVYLGQQKNELALIAFEKYLTASPDAPNVGQVRATIENLKKALNKK
jgi:tetratricopeptide (TPR) repeat protein